MQTQHDQSADSPVNPKADQHLNTVVDGNDGHADEDLVRSDDVPVIPQTVSEKHTNKQKKLKKSIQTDSLSLYLHRARGLGFPHFTVGEVLREKNRRKIDDASRKAENQKDGQKNELENELSQHFEP